MSPSLKICAVGFLAAVQLAAIVACSSSKGGGASPTSPSASQTATLRASDVLTGAAIPGATISGNGVTGGTTDTAGALTLSTTSASTFGIDIAGTNYIPRHTLLKVPGGDASVSLIPNTLDLPAFNEMFRNGASDDGFLDGPLRRWISQPSLSIVSNVVQYTSTGTTYIASGETLSDAELQSIRADLSYGLPLLTGGVFQNFSAIANQPPVAAGQGVAMMAEGRITFARCTGLTSTGLGTWQFRDDVVVGGLVCVDRVFELGGSNQLLAVRLHELGHALGYHHVPQNVKDKVLMNPVVSVTDVTPWDRDAAKIAFQRPTGNRTPDADPATFSTNRLAMHVMTVDGCRVQIK